ncbi:MAG TPA: hypothetical protein ENF34_04825 [Candidatus Bathyarchaeota archaeon]|nr:hypothetical protein [Candidatus Bathyarchaeota archaeon]
MPVESARDAIMLFQFSERVKSFLIVASRMVDGLKGLEGAELTGARGMFKHFLDAVMAEVRLAQNATRRPEFGDVNALLSEVSNLASSGLVEEAVRRLAEAISLTATCGSEALAFLQEKGLV